MAVSFISEGELQAGQSYLHRNWLFIRTIEAIEGETVFWHDQHGPGNCTRKVFVRQCIALAPKDERCSDEIKAEMTRKGVDPRSRLELLFEALCRDAASRKVTFISIEDPRMLGATYEEVMRNMLVLEEYHLYLRITP